MALHLNHISEEFFDIKRRILPSICVKGMCHSKSQCHSPHTSAHILTSSTNVVAGVTCLSETNVQSLLNEWVTILHHVSRLDYCLNQVGSHPRCVYITTEAWWATRRLYRAPAGLLQGWTAEAPRLANHIWNHHICKAYRQGCIQNKYKETARPIVFLLHRF